MPDTSRRLWQLDTAAHDLLLGLSFTADGLRALLTRTLGRLHHARCVLNGSDADVLYSVVHDLKARNPLSEAMQRALQQRHAVEVARWRRLRGAPALQQAWDTTLASDSKALPVGALWAVLTHPDGAAVEKAVLYDARQRAFALAQQAGLGWQRAAHAEQAAAAHRHQGQALQQRLALLQQAHAQLQQQLLFVQAEARGAARRARAAEPAAADARPLPCSTDTPDRSVPAAGLRIRASGAGTASMARPDTMAALPAEEADGVPVAQPLRQREAVDTPRTVATQATGSTPPAESLATAPAARPGTAAPTAPAVAGRRVLCVGGMPGTRQRYRALLEAAGARFEYHDGGLEDGIARLDSQLQAADVVVCHSGCLNHEAYRRIKLHCQRGDKPCVYLARPSLSTFARGLGLRPGALTAPRCPSPGQRPAHP